MISEIDVCDANGWKFYAMAGEDQSPDADSRRDCNSLESKREVCHCSKKVDFCTVSDIAER